MGQDYLPTKEAELGLWVTRFVTVATTNKTALGLTDPQLTALNGLQAAFTTNLNAAESAKSALHGATQAKDTAMKALTSDVRALVRQIQGAANVSDALKKQLGINARDTIHTKTPPVVPTDLTAMGDAFGVNHLKWNRNGNKPGTVFVVEAMIGTATTFVFVANTSKTKFDHLGQTPGVKVTYRVLATRSSESSVPSLDATVYGTAPLLTLLKAA